MKTKYPIFGILFSILVLGLSGCATPPSAATIQHVATATQIVAKDATTLYVQAHPTARAQFQQAHDALAVIETATNIDFATVLKIVQTFPIKELKNPTTVLLIQDSEIILTDLGASIPLTSVNDLRPIVTALRLGIEQGLGNGSGGAGAPPTDKPWHRFHKDVRVEEVL